MTHERLSNEDVIFALATSLREQREHFTGRDRVLREKLDHAQEVKRVATLRLKELETAFKLMKEERDYLRTVLQRADVYTKG